MMTFQLPGCKQEKSGGSPGCTTIPFCVRQIHRTEKFLFLFFSLSDKHLWFCLRAICTLCSLSGCCSLSRCPWKVTGPHKQIHRPAYIGDFVKTLKITPPLSPYPGSSFGGSIIFGSPPCLIRKVHPALKLPQTFPSTILPLHLAHTGILATVLLWSMWLLTSSPLNRSYQKLRILSFHMWEARVQASCIVPSTWQVHAQYLFSK